MADDDFDPNDYANGDGGDDGNGGDDGSGGDDGGGYDDASLSDFASSMGMQSSPAPAPAVGGMPAAALPPRVPIVHRIMPPVRPGRGLPVRPRPGAMRPGPAPRPMHTGRKGGIAIAAPAHPTITLAHAHQFIAQHDSNPHAARFVSRTFKTAATGHPTAIANREVLKLAHRLQVQAGYVAKYVGQPEAAAIAAGLHMTNPPQLPLGDGLYDPMLPRCLEETITAMRNTNRDPVQLQQFAEALCVSPL